MAIWDTMSDWYNRKMEQPPIDQGEFQQDDPGAPWRQQNMPTGALGPVYGPRTAVDEWMANTPWATPPASTDYMGQVQVISKDGYDWEVVGGVPMRIIGPTKTTGDLWNQDPDKVGSDAWYRQQQLNQADIARKQTLQQSMADYGLEQQKMGFQQQQWQQELAQEQKNYLAQLGANPKSWLEYAAAANTQPVIQPWMLPMMPQDYSGAGMPQAGQVIPGWNAQNMQGMPDLMNPSAQYWARMGPTAQQQYYGYQQADKAMTPEESQFRMWNMAPPGGASGTRQLNWVR